MTQVAIDEAIDRAPIGACQINTLWLCTLVAVWDGYDALGIAYTAPVIAAAWNLSPQQMGLLFGAAPLGMALGAIALAPLGDRIGRKATLILSCLVLGVASLGTAYAADLGGMIAWRVATGLGIGGALPMLATLTAEFSPDRLRNFFISIATNGFTIGTVSGGLLAAYAIERWGWESIFIVGGAGPLLTVPLLWLLLSESPHFLANRQTAHQRRRLVATLRRLLPAETFSTDDRFLLPPRPAGGTLRALFQDRMRLGTPMLWIAFFGSFFAAYFLFQWIPSIVKAAGFSLQQAIYAGLVTSVGSALGPIVLALLSARSELRNLISGFFLLGFACMAALGFTGHSLGLIMLLGFSSGFFVLGAEMGLYMYGARIYAATVRSTGMGWSLGMGRTGAICGPVAGGLLVGLGLGMSLYIPLLSLSVLVSAGAMCLAPVTTRADLPAPTLTPDPAQPI